MADNDTKDTYGLWRIRGILGVFVVVQSIEGYILTLRILGRALSLHPLSVFLGLLIGVSSSVYSGSALPCPPLPSPKSS